MQNFTLGKKGLSMLFFAFILLIGSSPSFGQACPTAEGTDENQTFCYLQTVGDIVSDGNAFYQTANNENDTQPIPESELLTDGETYFAGSTSGNCVRRPVTVSVINAPRPSNTITDSVVSGFEITFCTPATFNSDDLADLFETQPNYRIEIYTTEESTNPITSGTTLTPGASYFVGQVPNDAENPLTNTCPSFRVAVGFNPNQIEAPVAQNPQIFCESATVADLVAEGTYDDTQAIRWYRSQTANSPLADDTQLINGQSYFAAQVVNERGSPLPPCETPTGERAEVRVEIQQPVDLGTPAEGIICESEVQDTFPSVDAIRNFYFSLLPAGTPSNGTFSPTPEQLAAQYQNDADGLGSFVTDYTVGVNGCESTVQLTATVVAEQEANAGTIQDIIVECGNEQPIELATLPNDGGDPNGTFSGEGVTNGFFDPAIGPGTYTITYSVDESSNCIIEGSTDSTTFDITVQGFELGEPIVMEMCIIEVAAAVNSPEDAVAIFTAALANRGVTNTENGSFTPTLESIGNQIAAYLQNPTPSQTFETTYSVTTNCGEDSVLISLTINNTTAPEAGDINPAPVCASTTPFNLNSLLGESSNPGGTFSNQDGVIENGLFNVSQTGSFTITYTVTENAENCTAGEDDSTEFTLSVNNGAVAENPEPTIVCETDVDALFPSVDEIRKFYLRIANRAGFPTNGTFSPTPRQLAQIYQNDADGLGDFSTTYTFGTGDCQTSVQLTATIVPAEEANAGSIENVTLECENEELIVLSSLPNEGGNTGGTFSGEGVTNGTFDPSVGPGTYTITYSVDDSADCVTPGTSDSTTFTITVQDSFELGNPIALELCITEVQSLITNPQAAINLFNQALQDNGIENLDGTFTPGITTVANQIAAFLSNPTPSQTFETTYSVTTNCGEDSVLISLTIKNTTAPEAGDINPAPVCASTTPFNLNSLLGESSNPGGTFSNQDGVIENGLFNVSQTGSFTITYTVTENAENCTAGEDDSTEFTLSVNNGAVAENPEPTIVCETDVDALFPSVDEIRKFYLRIANRAGFPTNGTFSPTPRQLAQIYQNDADGLGDFSTTYTFGTGDCQTSVQLTATIVPAEEANAGSIENVTLECENEELIVLSSLPNEGGNTGGTFSGEGVTNGTFDPSVGPGTYTITYSVDDSADCVTPGTSDSTTFTITVQDSFELGNPIALELCITEVQSLITNPQAAINLFNQALQDNGIENLDGTFTPGITTVANQIAAFLSNPTPSQTFETTYSVTTNCGEDSVLISLTINNTTAPEAGDINPAPVCASTTPFNLNSLLGESSNPGGTFSNQDGVIENGLFNVSQTGSFTITYTVTENAENCTAGEDDSTEFTLSVNNGAVAENPEPTIVCETDVDALFPSVDEIRKFYLRIANQAGFPTNGTFNPTAAQLAQMYQNDEDGLGDFTTTYTFGEGDCQNSVDLTATIVAEEAATVNPIEDDTVCISEGGLDLSNYVSDNTMGGIFTSDNGTITGNTLDVSEAGTFNITYTVNEDDATTCLTGTASTEFTITVSENSFDAGADNSIEVCNADVSSLNTTGVRNLFLGLLEEGVPTNGTFEPTISQLITQYNTVSNFGDFTTTYTLGEGDCEDSAVLTVTVIQANDAGEDMDLNFCSTEDAVNLFDFLSPFATTTGTFVGYEDGMFDPATADAETVITYEVEEDDSECSTGNFTSTFTINVSEPEDANAGEDVTAEFCVEQDEDIQLSTLLTAGANLRGSFEAPFENGIFNPSVAGEGVYEIDYTVDEDDCAIGTATSTLTVTVTATGETPVADAEQSFCLIDEPTVADIVVEGDNIVIYQNADLTTEADATSPLVDGAVYYAVSTSGGNACGSDAVMITVTLTDADAPTLVVEGNEFCRSDSPTVQELINNLTGNGIQIYSSLTGGTALATTTALVDGTTYFASGTNSTTLCESSERRAIQVEVGFCGIPEGFSPNDDGINDEFVIPEIAEDFPNYTIQVYNRWGSLVFEGNASTGDWDGLSNQSATLGDGVLPAGVYFYILDYNDGQTQPVQGKVYLSR